MKILTNKKTIQKIIIAIVIILSFNFIVPNYSQASFGGVLLGPFIDLLAAIGDAVTSALQFFMYDGNITVGNTAEGAINGAFTIVNPFDSFLLMRSSGQFEQKLVEYDMDANGETPDIEINSDNFDKGWLGWVPGSLLDKDYGVPIIKYTPEKIFSNQVPALDVNFINPKDWTDIKDESGNPKFPNAELMNERSITQDLHSTIANWYVALRNLAIVALLSVLLYVGIRIIISSTASDKAKYKQMLIDWVIALCIVFFLHYIMSFILTAVEMITQGLDSGTEIVVQVLDSSNGDFTFKTDLTGLCRLQIQYSDLGARMIYLIFYLAIVIYTVMFTWTYIKRAITMAFLTLMAPLVAITYPIDKINDGKAQAYGIWFKEFVFNALLQPFHLIIYTIFLGSASEIAVKNPIYAILFLAFIIPSEKLLRKMFGFDKATTAGAMSTAAGILGGAAVMKSATNLIGKVGGKGKSGGGKTGVRTKNNMVTDSNAPSKVKDLAGTLGDNKDGNNNNNIDYERADRYQELTSSGMSHEDALAQLNNELPFDRERQQNTRGNNSTTNGQQLSQQTQSRNRELSLNSSSSSSPWKTSENDTRGMGEYLRDGLTGTLNKKSWGRKVVNGANAIRNMPSALKQLPGKAIDKATFLPKPIRNTIKGAVGVAGRAAIGTAKFAGKAALGGTIGLAAGIAGDDLEDVGKFGLAGAALGVAGLPVLGKGLSNAASGMRNTYETEAFGAEEAALREQAREKMKDDEYRESMDQLFEDMYKKEPSRTESRNFAKEGIDYYNAGITDTKEIKKSMKFEKELRDRMLSEGVNEDEASERAKKQAMIISNMASKIDEKELINESKRNDRRNQICKQLEDTGMDNKSAAAGADYTIQLLMQRKGLSPNK